MSAFVFNVTFDCRDPERLSDFWAATTGYERTELTPDFARLRAPDRRSVRHLLFFKVPEPRAGKNRVHVDLASPTPEDEVGRLEQLGARELYRVGELGSGGLPEPVAPGQSRRSVATYYYTAAETPGFSGDYTTHWREHGRIRARQRPRFWLSRVLMQASRGFSFLAHLANPNQGIGWRRRRGRD